MSLSYGLEPITEIIFSTVIEADDIDTAIEVAEEYVDTTVNFVQAYELHN